MSATAFSSELDISVQEKSETMFKFINNDFSFCTQVMLDYPPKSAIDLDELTWTMTLNNDSDELTFAMTLNNRREPQ